MVDFLSITEEVDKKKNWWLNLYEKNKNKSIAAVALCTCLQFRTSTEQAEREISH